MTLVASERGKEKENACPTQSIITKVEGEFRACDFEVSLLKATVDMIGSAPLVRGYEGIKGGLDFGYIFKSRTWSFKPEKATIKSGFKSMLMFSDATAKLRWVDIG